MARLSLLPPALLLATSSLLPTACALQTNSAALPSRRAFLAGVISSQYIGTQLNRVANAADETAPVPPVVEDATSNSLTQAGTLYETVRARHPLDWTSSTERAQVDGMIDAVTAQHAAVDPKSLPGTWRIAYIRNGAKGGLDRRLPIPERAVSDNYQIFLDNQRIVNRSELLSSAFHLEGSGSWEAIKSGVQPAPSRLVVNVDAAKLCRNDSCLKLPIAGQGFEDILYADERMRLVQSPQGESSGTGSIAVQVRVDPL